MRTRAMIPGPLEFHDVLDCLYAFAHREGQQKRFDKQLRRFYGPRGTWRARTPAPELAWERFDEFLTHPTTPHDVFWDCIRGMYAEERLKVEQAVADNLNRIKSLFTQYVIAQNQWFTQQFGRLMLPGSYSIHLDGVSVGAFGGSPQVEIKGEIVKYSPTGRVKLG